MDVEENDEITLDEATGLKGRVRLIVPRGLAVPPIAFVEKVHG